MQGHVGKTQNSFPLLPFPVRQWLNFLLNFYSLSAGLKFVSCLLGCKFCFLASQNVFFDVQLQTLLLFCAAWACRYRRYYKYFKQRHQCINLKGENFMGIFVIPKRIMLDCSGSFRIIEQAALLKKWKDCVPCLTKIITTIGHVICLGSCPNRISKLKFPQETLQLKTIQSSTVF